MFRRHITTSVRARLADAWRRLLQVPPRETFAFTDTVDGNPHAFPPHKAQAALMRAVAFVLGDNPEAAREALDSSALTDREARVVQLLHRFVHWRLGHWRHLYACVDPPNAGTPACEATARILDLALLAAADLEQLQLMSASRLATDALDVAQQEGMGASIAAASAATVLACVRYEMGYVDRAEEVIRGRMSIIKEEGMPDTVIRAYLLLTRIAHHRGQFDYAGMLLSEGQSLGEHKGWPRMVAVMRAERVRVVLARGQIDRAWIEVLELDAHAQTLQCESLCVREEIKQISAITRARIDIARGDPFGSSESLAHLHQRLIAEQRLYAAFQLSLDLIEALAGSRANTEARQRLLRLLETSAHVGLFQSLIDAGPGLDPLLAVLATPAVHQEEPSVMMLTPYLRSLISHRLAKDRKLRSVRCLAQRAHDRLSPRECAVLNLIAQGQSNKRVAQVLRIAPETVKSHLKRVFVKLGSKSRAEAVSRATDLGLLIRTADPARTARQQRLRHAL